MYVTGAGIRMVHSTYIAPLTSPPPPSLPRPCHRRSTAAASSSFLLLMPAPPPGTPPKACARARCTWPRAPTPPRPCPCRWRPPTATAMTATSSAWAWPSLEPGKYEDRQERAERSQRSGSQVLRFKVHLLRNGVEDAGRDLILNYYAYDDTLSIFEPARAQLGPGRRALPHARPLQEVHRGELLSVGMRVRVRSEVSKQTQPRVSNSRLT